MKYYYQSIEKVCFRLTTILKFQIILIAFFHVDMSNILKWVEKEQLYLNDEVNKCLFLD